MFFSLSSVEGRKQRRRPETFAPYMKTMPSERARQDNGFLALRRVVLTLVTLHAQEDLTGFDEDRLNTLIHNDPHQWTRELANVMNCDHSTILRHLYSVGKVQKSAATVPHALSEKKKNSGWPYVHLYLLVVDWLVNNIDHSYPVL